MGHEVAQSEVTDACSAGESVAAHDGDSGARIASSSGAPASDSCRPATGLRL